MEPTYRCQKYTTLIDAELADIRAPIANLGLWDYRERIWDYGITPCLKLGLQKSALDYASQIQPNLDFPSTVN